MQRSIAARYAAHPTARFATVAPRAREPRLGLDRHVHFRTVSDRPTLLRRPDLAPLAMLRADWRAVRPARGRRAPTALIGPGSPVHWASHGIRPAGRRPRAAAAPWRG